MEIIEPWYAQAELPAVPPKQVTIVYAQILNDTCMCRQSQ